VKLVTRFDDSPYQNCPGVWGINFASHEMRCLQDKTTSVTFINQLMHSIITTADVKIYVIQKSKRHTLKILQHASDHKDPSSGSDNLYLTQSTYNGSIVLIICVVGVWGHILGLWCVCTLCWPGSHHKYRICR